MMAFKVIEILSNQRCLVFGKYSRAFVVLIYTHARKCRLDNDRILRHWHVLRWYKQNKSCICFNSVQQIKLTIYSAPSIYKLKYYQPIQVKCFFQTFVSLAIEVRVVLLENDYFDWLGNSRTRIECCNMILIPFGISTPTYNVIQLLDNMNIKESRGKRTNSTRLLNSFLRSL